MSSSIGLINLGNTCFLNTVLQALRRCKPLEEYILNASTLPLRKESKKGALVTAFQSFLKDLKEPKGQLYSPATFLKALLSTVQLCDDDWYQPRQQADAAECLQYILDGIHDAIYRQVRVTIHGADESTEYSSQIKALQSWSQFFAKEYSPVVQHFYGQYQIRIQCQTCKTVSERYEPWLMLKAPIPGGNTVGAEVPTFEACMNEAFAPETIPDYACESCKSPQTATLTTRISKLPNILILTFKRFTNAGAKIRGEINWDMDALSFKQWLAYSYCPYTNSSMNRKYSTFAVIEHVGSSRGGHYRMYARMAAHEVAGEADTWLECDDELVRQVDATRVVSPDSYVIFAVPQ